MKMISLFDGSGGFPLAAYMCGIEPVAASEIEPFPIRVTTKRFPNMKHLGDISRINGAEIEPVDLVTFGSPCQDLSVAGKRKGLKHEEKGDEETTRSGLFMEAVRIIKEMRGATDGRYPTFAIWENVPGAFSSNKGADFQSVLEEICSVKGYEIHTPRPERWPAAGEIVADGFSLAWRVFNAQYWGVPQRRRRIYLVADFRGQRAGKILFEREGLRGYFEASGTPWKGTAADAERSIDADDREGKEIRHPIDVATQQGGAEISDDGICPMLSAEAGGNSVPSVCVEYSFDAIGNGDGKTVNTITGDHNNRITDYTTLICIPEQNDNEPSVDRPAVCYEMQAFGEYKESDIASALKARDYKDATDLVAESSGAVRKTYIVRRLTPIECARLQGFPDYWTDCLETEEPAEEDLLFWREVFETHRKVVTGASKPKTDKQIVKWLKNPYSDSAAYKMWGNGIALPNALYIMQGIYHELTIQQI